MDFGKKIQMLRKSQGLSQESLAAILNINRNNLSRIENGKSEPTLSVIRNMVNYFKVDVASLMDIEVNSLDTKEKIMDIFLNIIKTETYSSLDLIIIKKQII